MNPILNIAMKEVYIQLKTKRFYIIIGLFALLSLGFVYLIKSVVMGTPETMRFYEELYKGASPFQMIFTSSFSGALSNLLPFLGGLLGFDLINREIERGTIKITLSKPVYRDQFITGKFLGSTFTILIGLGIFYTLTIAFSLLLGIPISGKDLTMLLATFPFSLLYTLVFLALGTVFSIIVKKPSTALIALVLFIFFLQFIYPVIVSIVTMFLMREQIFQNMATNNQTVMPNFEEYYKMVMRLTYIVPSTHYGAIMGSIFGQKVGMSGIQFFGGSLFEERSLLESLSLVWQNIVTLIVMLLLPFAIAYAKFMRMDVK